MGLRIAHQTKVKVKVIQVQKASQKGLVGRILGVGFIKASAVAPKMWGIYICSPGAIALKSIWETKLGPFAWVILGAISLQTQSAGHSH